MIFMNVFRQGLNFDKFLKNVAKFCEIVALYYRHLEVQVVKMSFLKSNNMITFYSLHYFTGLASHWSHIELAPPQKGCD